jgi:hypothetical protein
MAEIEHGVEDQATKEKTQRRTRLLWAGGALLVAVGLASWWVWPHARRAAVGWRAIFDGVSIQNALNGDLAVDDEFARAAFAEFARISPEADVGQLHLHLVRPASRDGWNGADERPWLLNELADLRPWRSTSYFPSDTRITEAYADFLEQLKFEANADEQQRKEIERLRRDFTQALKTTLSERRAAARPNGTTTQATVDNSIERLSVMKGRLNNALGQLPHIGQIERAYLDFNGFDSDFTVKSPSGIDAPAARADLLPSFEGWLRKRSVGEVNQVRFAGVKALPVEASTNGNTQPKETLLIDLEAKDIAVFRISRGWFHQEILTQFRATGRSTSLFGAEGSLGVIPVGLVFARGLNISLRSPKEGEAAWRTLLEKQREVTFEFPASQLNLSLGDSTGGTRGRSVQLDGIGEVKLIGVICRWL